MNSIELIRENLDRSEEIVLSRIEEMREHCLVFPTPQGGCHTLWLLGHLAYIESLVIHDFMLGQTNPLSDWEPLFDGDSVSGVANDYPSFDDVLADCRRVREQTKARLNSLEESDLDTRSANVPETVTHLFGTYRRCFQYASDHWLMHRGQFADARRAAGIERMWY